MMATLLHAPHKVPADEICAQGSRNCRRQPNCQCQSEFYQRSHHNQIYNNHNEDDGDDDDDDGGVDDECDNDSDIVNSDGESLDEIPVWVRGEPRWISGLTKDTTCGQIVDALLHDEGIDVDSSDLSANQYVITERWRQVEQILNNTTKVLTIWTAWGETQSEVRLSLRRIGFSLNDSNRTFSTNNSLVNGDGKGNDGGEINGRYSPSRSNNIVMKRKRQRSSRSASNWMTDTDVSQQKSPHRPSIEKLMQLILEQGETIQQQLTQLRDRELQIADIEKATYQRRCGNDGKNYLLEQYLNGIQTVGGDGDKEMATGNSDSGVHTGEEVTTPEVGIDPDGIDAPADDDDDAKETVPFHQTVSSNKRKTNMSKREYELLREHECSRDFVAQHSLDLELLDDGIEVDDTSRQIVLLQKLIVMNKHLQREEELMVRLTAKIRKYECSVPDMTEPEIKEAIMQVNCNIERTATEMHQMEQEIQCSAEMLMEKSELINCLSRELEELELNENSLPKKSNNFNNFNNFEFSCDPLSIQTLTNSSYPLATLVQMNPYTSPEQIVPSFFQKDDCPIASVNIHADQRNINSTNAYDSVNKLGPKKFLATSIKDPDSDTGISSEDNSLLGTLV